MTSHSHHNTPDDTGQAPTPIPDPVGLLVVDKPRGPTSMTVCRVVKRALRASGISKTCKVGHGGTLDPLATGVVVVLIGRPATRLCDTIMAGQKTYLATIDLAHRSTTDDAEGELTEINVFRAPSEKDITHTLESFVGDISQIPPAHSAIWVNGQRAYDLARAGKNPALKARIVRVDDITIRHYAFPILQLEINCGKGTYIRSLARDIGLELGTGGMLAGLRRTRVGEFHIENATALDDIRAPFGQADLLPLPGQNTNPC